MSDLQKKTGPVALTTTLTTNILRGGDGTAGLGDLVTHIHVVNHTDADAKFSLWVGASTGNAAGTELFSKENVKARGTFEHYCRLPLTTADYIVGGADIATALAITISHDRRAV